ncbi:MAG: hypothetical protein Q4F29_14295 [Lachnospiraceae bacterium]|nr:hypothetical protein [Lachnospiraceae bacterium]
MKKRILLTAAVLAIMSAAPALAAGWGQDQTGWYYAEDNGAYAANGWREIEGQKYYFDANGYMVTGWQFLNGQWTYFAPSGALGRGWITDNGRWYFLNDDGTMKTGWMDQGRDRYYLYTAEDAKTISGAVEGAMASNITITLQGVTYYFDVSGKYDNIMAPFENGGIRYRYWEGALQWENINQKNDWIQYSTKEELVFDIQEQLMERYDGKRSYSDASQFKADAAKYLTILMDEGDLELYIDRVLEEQWGYNTGYSTTSNYTDEEIEYYNDFGWDEEY